MSHKIRNSNVKKNTPHLSGRFVGLQREMRNGKKGESDIKQIHGFLFQAMQLIKLLCHLPRTDEAEARTTYAQVSHRDIKVLK